MVAPALGEGLHHRVVSLARHPSCLVIHDVDQTARLVLQQAEAFRVVEVRNLRNEARDAFSVVLGYVLLKQLLLDEVLETLVSIVDAELIKGVRPAGHVLGSREIEETNERSIVILTKTLIDVFVKPCKE